MKRTTPKRAPPKKQPRKKPAPVAKPETCAHCDKTLEDADRALYVEEEIGRTFCSEQCIATYFAPDIERLEKDYFKYLPKDDLNGAEREKHAELRWTTLQEPQEIWREKTLAGDCRYTLISEYNLRSYSIWSVCICLLLRGEPSFLYLAFVTRKEELVDHYRRGERVQRVKAPRQKIGEEAEEGQSDELPAMDGLAEPWTEDEMQRAERIQIRRRDDIKSEEYSEYETCVEETLEKPDEIWTWTAQGRQASRYYHFIRHYSKDDAEHWYVIVARETDKEDQLEIMDLFPTRDPELVSRYRKGEQELGEATETAANRWVH